MIKNFSRSILGIIATLALTSVNLMAQAPASAAAPDPAAAPTDEWVAALRFGFNYNSGNTDTSLLDFGATANREVGDDIYTFTAAHRIGEADSVTNVDASEAKADYKHLFTERLYAGLGLGWMRDEIADVQYRVTIEPKIGYFIFKDPTGFSLNLETGPGYIFEEVGDISDDYLAPFIGERLDYVISDTAKIFQHARITFSADSSDNYLVKAGAGIETTVTESLSLITGVELDYDNEPALGRKKDDVRVVTSLNVTL